MAVTTAEAAVRTVLECNVDSAGANPAAGVTWYKGEACVCVCVCVFVCVCVCDVCV